MTKPASREIPPISASILDRTLEKTRLIIDNLQRKGNSALEAEEISVSTDAQVYELIEILYSKDMINTSRT
jgi:hypothetical protein